MTYKSRLHGYRARQISKLTEVTVPKPLPDPPPPPKQPDIPLPPRSDHPGYLEFQYLKNGVRVAVIDEVTGRVLLNSAMERDTQTYIWKHEWVGRSVTVRVRGQNYMAFELTHVILQSGVQVMAVVLPDD